MELNPHHPTTQGIRDHWPAIVLLLMQKMGVNSVCITPQDIENLPKDVAIVAQELTDGLHLNMVSLEEGQRLAREAGGLPQ